MYPTKLHGRYSNYHFCIVRECKNTSIKTPGKIWISVPTDKNIRKAWLSAAKRDPLSLSAKSSIYFCEDHFDLENDMENFMQYKIRGSVDRVRMKPHCVPSRFECNSDRKRKRIRTANKLKRASKKRSVKPRLEDSQTWPIKIPILMFNQESLDNEDAVRSCSSSLENKYHDKAVQGVRHTTRFRSQAWQFMVSKAKHNSKSNDHTYAKKLGLTNLIEETSFGLVTNESGTQQTFEETGMNYIEIKREIDIEESCIQMPHHETDTMDIEIKREIDEIDITEHTPGIFHDDEDTWSADEFKHYVPDPLQGSSDCSPNRSIRG